jgi:hypothetical protein
LALKQLRHLMRFLRMRFTTILRRKPYKKALSCCLECAITPMEDGGGEIGVPLTWCPGLGKRWNIQLEPYFRSLDFSEVQNIYGTRLLFDYRF